jgi:hypothetical protein
MCHSQPTGVPTHRSKSSALFDHFIGAGEQRRWHREAERPGRDEIDHEIELGRLLDWDVGRFYVAQNLVHEVGGAPV